MRSREALSAIENWYHRYQVLLLAMKGIEEEKRGFNYPISQSTEDMMFIAYRSVEFAMNACESELEAETDGEQKEVKART